jgi:sulfite exporter TauE/SafE
VSAEAATSLAAQVGASAATGLLMGFSHCLGMCGPLVASFGLSAGAGPAAGMSPSTSSPGSSSGPGPVLRAAVAQLPYHLGRVTTYAAIGAVMGATGAFVNVAGRLAGVGEVVALLAGALMVALGLGAAGVTGLLRQLEADASRRLMRWLRPLLQGGPSRLYPLGLALGFLPCGVSWTIFLGSAASGGPVPGLLMALAFGLATVPGLLLPALLGAVIGQRARASLRRAGGLVVAALGVLFILRGLGVHVPL